MRLAPSVGVRPCFRAHALKSGSASFCAGVASLIWKIGLPSLSRFSRWYLLACSWKRFTASIASSNLVCDSDSSPIPFLLMFPYPSVSSRSSSSGISSNAFSSSIFVLSYSSSSLRDNFFLSNLTALSTISWARASDAVPQSSDSSPISFLTRSTSRLYSSSAARLFSAHSLYCGVFFPSGLFVFVLIGGSGSSDER